MTLVRKTAVTSLLACTAAVPAFAQDAPGAVNTGALSFSAGADIVSTYFFRGIENDDSGFIVQPWAEVSTVIGDNIDLTLGTWSSVTSNNPGAGGGSFSRFFETDLYASLGTALTDELYGSITYTGFFSPSQAFETIEEISIRVDYDDSAALGDWAFSPYSFIAFELRDENPGGGENVYWEIGGAFGAPFIESEDLPVELSFPVVIGLSLDNFYVDEGGGGNEFFGFLLVGAAASTPLDFIPADYGTWTATAGIDILFLNGDVGLTDSGSDVEVVGKLGFGLEY